MMATMKMKPPSTDMHVVSATQALSGAAAPKVALQPVGFDGLIVTRIRRGPPAPLRSHHKLLAHHRCGTHFFSCRPPRRRSSFSIRGGSTETSVP